MLYEVITIQSDPKNAPNPSEERCDAQNRGKRRASDTENQQNAPNVRKSLVFSLILCATPLPARVWDVFEKCPEPKPKVTVITSYSIHYTKLYEFASFWGK